MNWYVCVCADNDAMDIFPIYTPTYAFQFYKVFNKMIKYLSSVDE